MGKSEEDKKLKQSKNNADSDIVETTDAVQRQEDEPVSTPDQQDTEADIAVADTDSPSLIKGTDTDQGEPDGSGADSMSREKDVTGSRDTEPAVPPPVTTRRSWLGLFNLLLIVGIMAGAYYYWQAEQVVRKQLEARLVSMEQQVEGKLGRADLSSLFEADRQAEAARSQLSSRLDEIQNSLQALQQSSEKLYELYGRDRNDWQLAEVEYLMRIAQHKLALENDFEGAAMTLRAASEKIAEAADPGLLPVRVKLSEEIAELKIRKRIDLVGISLTLTQLARQVTVLEPGFAVVVPEETTPQSQESEKPLLLSSPAEVLDRLSRFVDSQVRFRYENTAPSSTEANQMNVGESIREWLKLARWAVLDRNEKQYIQLLGRAEQLFTGFYSQDKVENRDFLSQLVSLKQLGLSSEKPDISGSLYMMREILQQRVELGSSGVTQ